MLGRKERDQLEFFISGSLRQLVPDDHILARVDRVLDLAWLRDEVSDLYCADNGRPGIDPEAAVRLMLAGFLLGLVHGQRRRGDSLPFVLSLGSAIRSFGQKRECAVPAG